ncbi:hypothetical protein [Nitrospira moscoviensis]|uniref:hypothetical protein n=1 Tax=Nitrospira moscoviensis TaxID=42253 RepID=UPI001930E40B|nr:hypothetical protein [Nitrospira moscoviensis]
MLNLKYSLVIEATDDPTFFGFFSTDLEGFSGIGHSMKVACTRHAGGWKSTWLF